MIGTKKRAKELEATSMKNRGSGVMQLRNVTNTLVKNAALNMVQRIAPSMPTT
jgi:hypothetical protein